MKRIEVIEKLSAHYTEKMGGKVWAYFDQGKRTYCIRGEGLPAHPELKSLYPNGWSLLDFLKPTKARGIV